MNDPETTLRELVRGEPRTLAALEAIVGAFRVVDDDEWFSFYRPGIVEPRGATPPSLSSASVTFHPYRTEGDPRIVGYRIGFPIPVERAVAIVRGVPGAADKFAIRDNRGAVLVDWTAPTEPRDARPYDVAERTTFLAALPARLAAACTAPELEGVLARPPAGAGITSEASRSQRRVGLGLVDARVPRVELVLDPPHDVRELCALWNVQHPIASSSDSHQSSWHVSMRGEDVPDEHGRRIASQQIVAGAWWLRPRLVERPAGPLPGVSCGASPAYDLNERGGLVARIEITHVD